MWIGGEGGLGGLPSIACLNRFPSHRGGLPSIARLSRFTEGMLHRRSPKKPGLCYQRTLTSVD